LLTGERPYTATGLKRAEFEQVILNRPARSPSQALRESPMAQAAANARSCTVRNLVAQLSGDLDVITLKALRKAPGERYATADALSADIECFLEGEPIAARGRNSYTERYIHAAIYRVRPDVKAVVHSHSPDVIPYSVSGVTLRPVYHNTAFLRLGAPVFDSQKEFGDTDMLIRDNKLGDALAKTLGNSGVVLIRGHGFVAVAYSTQVAVYRAIYTQLDARVQAQAMKLGEVKFLTPSEAEKAQAITEGTSGRPWELWKARVGKIE